MTSRRQPRRNPAFDAVSGVSALATLVFAALPSDAGAAVSGHRRPAE